MCLTAGLALADTVRWDSAAAPGVQTGDGNWNLTETEWRDESSAVRGTFIDGDDVIFGAPSAGPTGSPVISIDAGNVRAASLTFTADGYDIAGPGGDLAVGAGGARVAVAGSNTATISAGLQAVGGVRALTVDNAAGATLILSGDNGGADAADLVLDVTGGTVEVASDLSADVVARDGGTVIAQGATALTGETTVRAGGTLVAAGGDFSAGVDVEAGTYRVTGNSVGDVTQTGGAVIVTGTGTLGGDLAISAGTATNDGTIGGAIVQAGGTVTNRGDVGGPVELTGGQFINGGDGAITGATVVDGAGAVLRGNGGDFGGGVTLRQGRFEVGGNSAAELMQTGGVTTIAGAGALQGHVELSGGQLVLDAGGELDGTVTQTGGRVTNGGTILDGVAITGGTLTGQGNGDVRGLTTIGGTGVVTTGSGNFTGGVRVDAGGTLSVTGNSTADVRQNAGSVNITAGGTLDGRLTQVGPGTATNAGLIAGDVIRSGGTLVNIAGGTVGSDGTMLRQSGGLTRNAGRIEADVQMSGGTFRQQGGTIAGDVDLTGGRIIASGGALTGDVVNRGGAIDVTGAVTGDLTTRSGTTSVLAGGRLTGTQAVEGGAFRNAGTVAGPVNVTGGQATLLAGSQTGAVTVRANGQLQADGGRLTAGARVVGTGRATVGGAVTGNITVAGALSPAVAATERNLNIAAGGNLTGDVTVTSGAAASSGRLTGRLLVTGGDFQAFAGSDVTGPSRVSGGTVTLSGGDFSGGLTASGGGVVRVSGGTGTAVGTADVTVEDGGLLDIDPETTIAGTVTATGGRIVNEGTLDGTLTASGGTTAQGGIITGAVRITGGAVLTATTGSRIDGATVLAGGGRIEGQGGAFAGGLAVNQGGLLNVTGEVAGTFSTSGTGLIQNSGTLTGAVTNDGRLTGAGQFAGFVTNTGRIDNAVGGGNLQLGGGVGGQGGIVDLTRTAATGDEAQVGGAGVGDGQTLRFNVNIAERTADRLILQDGASMSGDLRFEFYREGTQGDGGISDLNVAGRLDTPIVLVEANGGGDLVLPVSTNLAFSTQRFVLGLDIQGDRVVLESDINPAFGAIVGNVVLTQSLIGSVINRPTSAAFTPLQDAEDPCGGGMWGRVTAGQADATGTVTTDRTTAGTATNASYQGILLGGDFSCSRGVTGGVNFAVGGLIGLNQGSTDQPISPAIFQTGGTGSGEVTSINESEFRQTYVGAYGVLTRGPLAVDLQLRTEQTDFDIANIPVAAGAEALFDDTSFGSNATTLSGSVTYTFPIRDTGFALTPRVGFSYTKTSTDEIRLSNPAGAADDILQVNDFDNQVGFVGLAIGRSRPLATNDGGTSTFLSATYYNDFADDPTATLAIAGSAADTENLTLTNLGSYGEISAGYSYVRQLKGGIGGARQLSATLRGDARTGGSLDSWGITGQVRLQF